MAVLKKIVKMSLVFRICSLQYPVSMGDTQSPFPIVNTILRHQHPTPMLQPIDIMALISIKFGNFHPKPLHLIIGILPMVPAPIALHKEPLTLPQIILQHALIQSPIAKHNNSEPMTIIIVSLPYIVLGWVRMGHN